MAVTISNAIRKHPLLLGGNPIYYRIGTDDLDEFNDVLVQQEYGCTADEPRDPKLVIDCGPTSGYTTLYFLNKYETAHVIAIEPDPFNFEICRLNLEPYRDRVTLLQAAVWPEAAPLVLRREWIGSTREWASRAFVPRQDETATTRGVELGAVLRDSGFDEIDLLKLATNNEADIFANGTEKWLPCVRNIVARLIEKPAEDAFFQALGSYQFLLGRAPTLVSCTRLSPAGAVAASVPPNADENRIENGGFEYLRPEPARIIPGGWEPGPHHIARDWQVAVCDPLFLATVAVRTGAQHSGESALCLRTNSNERIPRDSAPYAAVRNVVPITVQPGERWRIGAFVRIDLVSNAPEIKGGAYVFMRLTYDDGTFTDLRTPPYRKNTRGEYVELNEAVVIPVVEGGRTLESATLWVYAWLEPGDDGAALPFSKFLFDDVFCVKVE